MVHKTLLQHFVFSVQAAAFRRAVTPATEAKNALLAHASPCLGAHTDHNRPAYPAAVQTLLDIHDAEITAVTQLFFGPSHFSRFVDRVTFGGGTAHVSGDAQTQPTPLSTAVSRPDSS